MRSANTTLLTITGTSWVLLVALSILQAMCSLSHAAEARSPSDFVIESFREALAAASEPPKIVQINETIRGDGEVRWLVRHRVEPGLVKDLMRVSARDFQVRLENDPYERHVGVLVLRYSNPEVAARKLAFLPPSYFVHSKILIPFNAVQAGDYVAVIYTETSGDDRIVAFLKQLPERFKSASADSPVWIERQGK